MTLPLDKPNKPKAGSKYSRNHYRHGFSRTPTHRAWSLMKDRCLNKNSTFYKDYGGRGISVCERWLKFDNFLEDMGPKPKGLTLDRINNNGNYSPGNCRWASTKEQARNRRSNVLYSIAGVCKTLGAWHEEIGVVCIGTAKDRIMVQGWDIVKALTTPPIPQNERRYAK